MQWNAGGNQHYDALLIALQRRLASNVAINANWTWSHCIGQLLGYNTKGDQTITNPNEINEVGNCDTDRRNIFNITAVAQMPRFSNTLVRTVASGWKMSLIYRYIAGIPGDVQDGTDQALTSINHQQPNLATPGADYTGQSCGGCFYLNKAAFALQPLGTQGNLGWNSITGPGYWDVDMALSRDFRITERQHIELRADAFNLPNSFTPGQISTVFGAAPTGPSFALISSAQFGQILAANARTRKIQISH